VGEEAMAEIVEMVEMQAVKASLLSKATRSRCRCVHLPSRLPLPTQLEKVEVEHL